ncbi:hypothetical protein BH24CHL4_BH24CHL4_15740 [soil metagenome]
MATIDDFSADELQQIQHAPVYVIAGAVASETTGAFGSRREMIDGVEGFAKSMAQANDSLLTEIFKSIDQTQPDDFDIDEVIKGEIRDATMKKGIESAAAAYNLLASKAEVVDADAYAESLLRAASAAVRAAKTGGFLGFGAETITDREAEYVKRLAGAVGR